MALLFMDSFDHYASGDFLEKWTSKFENLSNVTIGAFGRRSSNAVRAACPNQLSSYYASLTKVVAPTGSGFVIGVALKFSANVGLFLQILDAGSSQVSLVCNGDMTISLRRGGTTLATSTATLVVNQFAYLEFMGLIHGSAGSLAVRVDGSPAGWPSYSGNTQGTGTVNWNALQLGNQIGSGSTGTSRNADYDDLYICDQSGAAPWNAFLGDVRVDVRTLTGSGALTQWTPSAGANWQNVDDAAPNDDTDYNAAASSGLTDTFVVEDAAVPGATIYGVQVNLSAKKSDAGTCSLASVVRQAGSNQVAAAQNPGTSYAFLRTLYQVNPHTSAQWTEADFNAAEFGYTRTA